MYRFKENFTNEKEFSKTILYSIAGIFFVSLVSLVFFRKNIIWAGSALTILVLIAILAFLFMVYRAFSKHLLSIDKGRHQRVLSGFKKERSSILADIRKHDANILGVKKEETKQKNIRTRLFNERMASFQSQRGGFESEQEAEIEYELDVLRRDNYDQQVEANPIVEAKIPGIGTKISN